MKTLVTSYEDPDLDGFSCAYAYTELLQKLGRNDIICAIAGVPHREAQFVINFNKVQFANFDAEFLDHSNIILVDSSDTLGISKKINTGQVIEIIDHRKVNQTYKFKNAKCQIEFVGAAATLIYEKFKQHNITPSENSAQLLYCAIVSNTINFKSKTTTPRDVKAAEELKSQANLPNNFIRKMFAHKSRIDNIDAAFEAEFALSPNGNQSFGIVQLELYHAQDFVKTNIEKLVAALEKIKKKESKKNQDLKYFFLTCIDIDEGKNTILCTDEMMQRVLESCLQVKFKNNVVHTNQIIMRKEMIPLIKEILK